MKSVDKDDGKLKQYRYRDIKCNVLIEYQKKRIIGEIQFILKFMLNAKKRDHKVYELKRKDELFHSLHKQFYQDRNDREKLYDRLAAIGVNHNMNQLCLFLQTMNSFERKFIETQDEQGNVIKCFQDCKFAKGLTMLSLLQTGQSAPKKRIKLRK